MTLKTGKYMAVHRTNGITHYLDIDEKGNISETHQIYEGQRKTFIPPREWNERFLDEDTYDIIPESELEDALQGARNDSHKIAQIYGALLTELVRAETLHPDWPKDIVYQGAIVNEESGELMKAILNHRFGGEPIEEVVKEAIQTGSMVIRFLANLADIEQLIGAINEKIHC